MANPYGHIRYFRHSNSITGDDETDGISSVDNAHLPMQSTAPSNFDEEESVGSGILRIKSREQELENVLSRNLHGKSDATFSQDDEEQRSESTYESTNVGTLRRELEDADRIHSLALRDYLKVLDVKPPGSESSSNPRHMTSAAESNKAVPLENLTWNDLMKASASRSASLAESDSTSRSQKAWGLQDNRGPLSRRRRNRIAWIALLFLFVIGIIVVVVVNNTDESVMESELSISGVKDSEGASLGDASDTKPDVLLPPVQAPATSSEATSRPSEPKGPGANPPSPTKEPTHKEPLSPTKSPSIPIRPPSSSPTSSPVIRTPPPVQVPSSSPGSTALRDIIVRFLQQEYGVDFQHPHNVASVDWLLMEGIGSVNHKLAQRFSLKVLDYSLREHAAPAGNTWDGMAMWAPAYVDECRWNGVKCNAEGFVSELHIGGRSYGGRIPKELRILQRSLEFLDLSKNNIFGTIPEAFFQLTRLERVYLYQNNLSGGISPSWALLQNLTHLHMSHNLLTSSLPNDLRRMTNLRYLNLYRNQISGNLPHYMKYMSSLWYLDLGRNLIDGDLPDGWGDGMVSLRHLYLDHNQIDKYIPGSYDKLGNNNLQVLALNDNYLVGSVPLKNQPLVTLNVHNNRLSKTLDNDVCTMSIFASGKLVDFSADCNICGCEGFLCDECSR